MADVQLSEIEKRFGGNEVISGLNFTAKSGQYVVLLGKSGCGKTTTLKIVAGLIGCDAGRVLLDGIDVTRTPPRKRDVSIVFQHDAMYPHLTIQESILFGLAKSVSAGERKQRINAACEITGAGNLLKRRPANLSGGELRRAAVTKAIVRRAPVRLLDEPLSALDAPVRHSIQRSLLDWHRDTPGTTIHVTHDGQVAMAVADRIAVMEAGKIVQYAKPAEIYNRPASRDVALAIGTLPIQLLKATLKDGSLDFQNESIQSQVSPTHLAHSPPSGRVDVGIRASAFQLVQSDSSSRDGIKFTGEVQRVEQLDARRLAHLRCGADYLTVDIAAHSMNIGDSLSFFVDASDLHVFDAASGARL